MPELAVNGAELTYAEAGDGPLLVLLHGQLCDYCFWTFQMAPLAERFHVVAPSLRHYWPGHCDEDSTTFTTHQHALDVGALIETLGEGKAHLCGHSRGGYVAFQTAYLFPDTVRTLILAEPGGPVDVTGDPAQEQAPPASTPIDLFIPSVVDRLKADDVEGVMALFFDTIQGAGAWAHSPEPFRAMARANAMTLVAQARFESHRRPITLAQIEAVGIPSLLIGGAMSPAPFPQTLSLLESKLPKSERVVIADASHAMNLQNPVAFNTAVLEFLDSSVS